VTCIHSYRLCVLPHKGIEFKSNRIMEEFLFLLLPLGCHYALMGAKIGCLTRKRKEKKNTGVAACLIWSSFVLLSVSLFLMQTKWPHAEQKPLVSMWVVYFEVLFQCTIFSFVSHTSWCRRFIYSTDINVLKICHVFWFCRCYARLHPRAVNCRKKKCGHSNQVWFQSVLIFSALFFHNCNPCLCNFGWQLRPKKKIK